MPRHASTPSAAVWTVGPRPTRTCRRRRHMLLAGSRAGAARCMYGIRLPEAAPASGLTRPRYNACQAAALQWRRGELNPRPKTTPVMASTCLADNLISTGGPGIGALPVGPTV